MAEFKVTPELLRSSSRNIATIKSNVQTTMQNIEAEMRKMKNDWDSEAANAFISKFLGLKDNFEAYYKVIEQYSKFLETTATTYTQTDSEISKASGNLFS